MTSPLHPVPAAPWQRLLPAVAVIALLLLVFRETGTAMVSVWSRSDTFAHAFLVPPISLWLIWRKRVALAGMPLQPVPWLLLIIAAVCVFWLLGSLAAVNAATQFALVTLIVLSVPAVAGWRIARVLAFPLLFLYFAVPMGEFLLPSMMLMTADFTVAAVRMSGVPVYRDGLQFVIPSGSWSVVEACSGVRYLIASLMVGTLFAYLNYYSLKRRLLFVAASILIPIVANWVRAYIIVMMGHLSGNELAVGADHLIYGWVFFGIVIGIMFLVGARWSEAPPATASSSNAVDFGGAASVTGAHGAAQRATAGVWLTAVGIAALVLTTQTLDARLSAATGNGPVSLQLPEQLGPWQRAGTEPLSSWTPHYPNALASQHLLYTQSGQRVGVWLGYYRDQRTGPELIASSNSLVSPASTLWTVVTTGRQMLDGQRGVQFATATLRDSADPAFMGRWRLQVWQVYWVGGRLTSSPVAAKLWMAWNQLTGTGDDSAAMIFYTPIEPGQDAKAVLSEFVGAQMGQVTQMLERARMQP